MVGEVDIGDPPEIPELRTEDGAGVLDSPRTLAADAIFFTAMPACGILPGSTCPRESLFALSIDFPISATWEAGATAGSVVYCPGTPLPSTKERGTPLTLAIIQQLQNRKRPRSPRPSRDSLLHSGRRLQVPLRRPARSSCHLVCMPRVASVDLPRCPLLGT